MFCRYCGTRIADDSVFCASCGKRLSEPEKAESNAAGAQADPDNTNKTPAAPAPEDSDTEVLSRTEAQSAPSRTAQAPSDKKASESSKDASVNSASNSASGSYSAREERLQRFENSAGYEKAQKFSIAVSDEHQPAARTQAAPAPQSAGRQTAKTQTKEPEIPRETSYSKPSYSYSRSGRSGNLPESDSERLSNAIAEAERASEAGIAPQQKAPSPALLISSIAVTSVTLVLFLILYYKMAPGFGKTHVITYAIGVVTALLLFGEFIILQVFKRTKTLCAVSLFLSAVIAVFCIGTHAVYNAKFEDVYSSVPANQYVNVHVEAEYAVGFRKQELPEDTQVLISLHEVDIDGVFRIHGKSTHSVFVSTEKKNSATEQITFEPEKLKRGQSELFKLKDIKGEPVTVTLTFTRVISFWEVVAW